MTTALVREVAIRYRGARRGESFQPLKCPFGAAEFIRRVLPDNARKNFVVLFLDRQHQVVSFCVAAIATAASYPVAPREVFQAAILSGAITLIVAHNHPSGTNVTPSDEDRAVTKRLWDVGNLLGIPLLDHIIIAGENYYSFKEKDDVPFVPTPKGLLPAG